MTTAIAAFTYDDARDFLKPRIEDRYDNGELTGPKPVYLPMFNENDLKAPKPFIVLSVGGGAGLKLEGLYDQPFITMRVIGRSQDYVGAELLALACDFELCTIVGTIEVNGKQVNRLTRAGGRPALLLRDNAERYHLTCSYIIEAESGF